MMISAKREVGCSLHVVYWEHQGNLPRASVLLDPEKTSIQEKENKVKWVGVRPAWDPPIPQPLVPSLHYQP